MNSLKKRIGYLIATLLMAAAVVLPLSVRAADKPAQPPETSVLPENPRVKYNAGSCRRLEGKPYVLVVYLDDDESNWTEKEVLSYQQELIEPALTFMEENAKKWGVFLDIGMGYFATYGHPDRPVKYDGIVEDFNDGKTSDDILEQVARTLGHESKTAMHDAISKFAGTEQVAYIIMMDKGGRSYSVAHYKPEEVVDQHYWMEYCLVFSGFTDTSRDSASDTIAHEMLHLFGAEDYYYPEGRKALANQYYPKDIMLCNEPDLQYFTLDEYTAYTLGWTDEIPEVCYMEDWWKEDSDR